MSKPLSPLRLRIGPVGVSFQTDERVEREELADIFRPFLAAGRGPYWRIDFHKSPLNSAFHVPRVSRRGDRCLFVGQRFSGDVSLASRRGVLKARSTALVGVFLRAFLSQLLSERRGLLVHSAGMIAGKSAYVFPGASGSGKSTIARLFPRGGALSDEVVVLQKEGRSWKAFGTPFAGELSLSRAAGETLSAVCFLEKDSRWEKRPMPPAEAARRLLRCVLNFSRDPGAYRGLLDSVTDLVKRVPAYSLSFAKTLPKETPLERFLRL